MIEAIYTSVEIAKEAGITSKTVSNRAKKLEIIAFKRRSNGGYLYTGAQKDLIINFNFYDMEIKDPPISIQEKIIKLYLSNQDNGISRLALAIGLPFSVVNKTITTYLTGQRFQILPSSMNC